MNRAQWLVASAMTLACGVGMTAARAAVTTNLDDWGAVATISSATCAATPTDFCGNDLDALTFASTLAVSPIDGGAGATSASVSSGAYPAAGSARAEGIVSGDFAVPLLRAAAASSSNAWIGGQALVVQGYSYTGAGLQTLQLDWTLEGDIVNPDADPVTGLVAFIGFFDVNSLSFPDVGNPLAAYTALTALALSSPVDNLRLFNTDGAVFEQGTLSIDVDTGASFYLVMGLMAGAGGAGASAESLSTLTAAFAGVPAITPSITAVPLPAAAYLLMCGLVPLASTLRRRH